MRWCTKIDKYQVWQESPKNDNWYYTITATQNVESARSRFIMGVLCLLNQTINFFCHFMSSLIGLARNQELSKKSYFLQYTYVVSFNFEIMFLIAAI